LAHKEQKAKRPKRKAAFSFLLLPLSLKNENINGLPGQYLPFAVGGGHYAAPGR
jgi:hypothetical protein